MGLAISDFAPVEHELEYEREDHENKIKGCEPVLLVYQVEIVNIQKLEDDVAAVHDEGNQNWELGVGVPVVLRHLLDGLAPQYMQVFALQDRINYLLPVLYVVEIGQLVQKVSNLEL